ncbi:beta family protein [Roseateles chitinivorans]|uniref:beta family protein n=1 Tax=Roseateles chitinivorans TaxID=2917965 RepID=UPI003D67AB6E
MNGVLLDEIVYFPSLQTMPAELRALRELDRARKRRILPLITLSPLQRMPDVVDFRRAAQQAGEAMQELPHCIDLGRVPLDHALSWRRLADPSQGFRTWREFAQAFRNAVPVVLMPDGASERAVVLQAAALERECGRVVFRLRGAAPSTAVVERALEGLEDPRRALVVLDFGTEREWLLGCAGIGLDLLARWRTRWPGMRVVMMGNSFPAAAQWLGTAGPDDSARSGRLAILERELHRRLGGLGVVGYGDHGAVHTPSEPGPELPTGHVRIDYPWQGVWHFERRRRANPDDAGREAAEAVVAEAPCFGERNLWGEHEIREAAQGRIFTRTREAWTAIRVNLHLATQVDEMALEACGARSTVSSSSAASSPSSPSSPSSSTPASTS